MDNLELQKEITSPQENLWEKQSDRLWFLDNPQFADIKNPLSKTINNLADEHIITPEDEFRKNIEQVTKDIFSDPLFEFDAIAKENQANNIFLFRTKFEEIKKENEKLKKETEGIINTFTINDVKRNPQIKQLVLDVEQLYIFAEYEIYPHLAELIKVAKQ